MAGVLLGQVLADGQAVLVGPQRLLQATLRDQHVADLIKAHRQIALPAGMAGVLLGQVLAMAKLSW